ncbi:aminotransferase class I/II-fold pyridoxal phosphate-dependent enzyme [soil metagenome]
MTRIYLSPPDVGDSERALLVEAFDSNWIAPLGPHVDAFESELAQRCCVAHVAALSSGTAALHLALHMLGVGPGDDVLTATLTFAATANAITYVGARPVFVDADASTWQLDPDLLADELSHRAAHDRLPAAVLTVDLYGQCSDYDRILAVCDNYEVPVIEDAAEALGATYRGRPAGSFGTMAALSFNGNKIITTSGGGALLSDDEALVARARFLATQARDPAPHYEHSTIGFNYRLSNLLAAVGRGQLAGLDTKVASRRRVNDRYRAGLGGLPGVSFMPEADYGEATFWLTCLTLDAEAFGATREDVRLALAEREIEGRPLWKPMHLQPVFADAPTVGGSVAADLFQRGLCLPSGSNLTEVEQDEVIEVVRSCSRA